MSQTNSQYWQKRFETLQILTERKNEELLKAIEKNFRISTENIREKLQKFYLQFSEIENISYLEAKRVLNSDELEEFHMSVEEYMALLEEYDNTLDEELYKKLERASLKYRVTRLEAIELQLMCEVARAYKGVPNQLLEHLKDVYLDRYYRSSFAIFRGYGIGVSFEKIDTKTLTTILKKPWTSDGIEFSERVWNNRKKLVENLETELSQQLVLGQGYAETAKKLSKKMDTEFYKCRRIVATESAYFSSLAQERCWEDLEVEKYEIVATLDMKTSEICQEQDGTEYLVKDFEPGKTAPPFHVNCRSTTCPVSEFKDMPGYIVGERAARGKDGKTYYVPADMNYKEWYKKYIDS